jgi:hypothetical protein
MNTLTPFGAAAIIVMAAFAASAHTAAEHAEHHPPGTAAVPVQPAAGPPMTQEVHHVV